MKRRNFLLSSTSAIAASTILPEMVAGQAARSANSKVNVAFIGSGGWIAQQPYKQGCSEENLVAFCDVDSTHCAENLKSWRTTQPFFEDFRVMFDKMGKEIDAVVINTPDHTHFAATMAAMERGIHVYTQKPLTHNVWQARTLLKAKDRYKVVTQMGNQGHAGDGIRQSVEAYRAGWIGDVAQVFCHNTGPQMGGQHFANPTVMPLPEEPIPAGLHWDLWQGPVAARPYNREYHPAKWRSFYEFGLGMLGDWGCHTLDTPVWALDLDAPTKVECLARKESLNGVIPAGSHIKFHFPATANRGPVTLEWFDGPQDWTKIGRIDKFGADHAAHRGLACWMVGSKGLLGCGTHAGPPTLADDELHQAWLKNPPEPSIPRVAGGPFREWLRAIKGDGPEPGSNFSYSAKLTEIVLLGVIAQRFNTTIEWDAKAGKIVNAPELNAYIKEPVRPGWQFGEELWNL